MDFMACKPEEALSQLILMTRSKLKQAESTDLYDYLAESLSGQLSRTGSRTKLTQVAESHIESMINARHKSGKMQWTQGGWC